MINNNYMQVLPGGHCMYCHKDYKEMSSEHKCFKKLEKKWINPTACVDGCSIKFQLKLTTIEGKLDYIIKLLEAK
jgi:ribosome-associated toxin RatA of RatAB toxin-antitoxin module